MKDETMRYMPKVAELSGSKLVEVPDYRRASTKSLLELDCQIQDSVNENATMRSKSEICARRRF